VILVVTTIAANIAIVYSSRRTQKREVNFAFAPASKEEFDKHVEEDKAEHDRLTAELKQDRHDNQIHASQRSSKIFDEIKNLRTDLEKKIDDANKTTNGMPDRIVALLKNLGFIKR
jgi:hypothetical protein